jgi:hypothetical protein
MRVIDKSPCCGRCRAGGWCGSTRANFDCSVPSLGSRDVSSSLKIGLVDMTSAKEAKVPSQVDSLDSEFARSADFASLLGCSQGVVATVLNGSRTRQ